MRILKLPIFISLLIFTFSACDDNKEAEQIDDNDTKQTKELAVKTPVVDTTQMTAQVDTTTTAKDATANGEEATSTTTEPVQELEKTETLSVTSTTAPADIDRFRGGISDARMSWALETIAQNLEKQKLKYDHTLGQDCSGIYHRVKDSLQVRFPTLKQNFQFPQYNTDRNTRQIAHWYHENDNLHFVRDAKAEKERLRPGTVLFFGRTDEKYSELDIDLLSNANEFVHNTSTGKGKIYHIAVVTAVREKDGKRRVTIMHGRNSRHPASRTEVNYDGPGGYKKAFAKYPFGNWNQQLVAIAHIATPK